MVRLITVLISSKIKSRYKRVSVLKLTKILIFASFLNILCTAFCHTYRKFQKILEETIMDSENSIMIYLYSNE